jgi:hypothetical protein
MTTGLVLSGSAVNVTSPLASSVTGLANNGAGLVRVTTFAPHLYAQGDVVFINCGSTLTGLFPINVITSNTFDLQGSTFTSTATGAATDMSLTPQIMCPVDGMPMSAQLSGLLSSLQGIMDRTQYLTFLLNSGIQSGSAAFTSSGAWTCPVSVRWALAVVVGGGGGGGGGMVGTPTTANQTCGGGGGGAADLAIVPLSVTPGTTYTVTVGAGGTAGVAGTGLGASLPTAGGRGGDSVFSSVISRGAVGGGAQTNALTPYATAGSVLAVLGGAEGYHATQAQPAGNGPWLANAAGTTQLPIFPQGSCQGGHSFAEGAATYPAWPGAAGVGNSSPGGAAGAVGANSGLYIGGAGGGGGAGGPGGTGSGGGGAGGAGGNANSGGVGVVGGNGTNGAAFSGSGGGGGGAGGSGTSSGHGGAGGAGGSGVVALFWIQGAA